MSFYVTLPSNSSMKIFDNTISNFTTQLQIPIKLHGPYEVALVEIIYDHLWDVDVGKLTYIHADKIEFQVPLLHQDGETLEQLISKANTELGTKIIEYEIEKYKSTRPNLTFEQMQKHLLEKFNKNVTFKDDNDKIIVKNAIPIVQFKSETNELLVNTASETDMYVFKGLIAKYIGVENLYLNSKSPSIKIDSKYNSNLNIINSLYVYTDIIQYQYVGDALAPLLRNVEVPYKSQSTQCLNYDSPHYVSVNKSYIDTINIKILDEQGNNIRFKRGKSIVKLHFRPANGL